MKKKILKLLLIMALTTLYSHSKEIDYEKIYKERCIVCHGSIHQGDIGADLRPKYLKMKDPYRLSSSLIDGVADIMPSFIHLFSKSEAIGMVDWLMSWEDHSKLKLNLKNVNRYQRALLNRDHLRKKYKKPVDVDSLDDITFLTERDASVLSFIDSTKAKVLSRHRAGYAVHVTIQNKKFPRYAYSLSRSGRVTMFDLMTPGQVAIAQVRVGEDSRGLAISNDGKYLIAGNYYPSGAVILDALTLKALKVIDTSSIEGMDGEKISSKVAELSSTPYAPYFMMVLKEAGRVQIIDYSKSDFPIIGDIKNIGHNLHDAFFNQDKGEDFGRYYMVSEQSKNGVMAIIDIKEKKLIKKIHIDKNAKPHSGQGASWYNKRLKKQLHATLDMNLGLVSIWDSSWRIVKQIETSDAGLFIGTSDTTPYLWADCAYGKEKNYNEINLIGKESLELEKIIKIGKNRGKLIDNKTQKIVKEWDATQYIPPNTVSVKSKTGKERILPYVSKLQRKAKYPIQPRLLHAEPANHGKWMMVSEWTTGRVGIYDSKSGEFVKYINNLITPTYTYSVEHRKNMPGS